VSARGRWVSRSLLCACGGGGGQEEHTGEHTERAGMRGGGGGGGAGGGGGGGKEEEEGRMRSGYRRACEFADAHDEWVWVPFECVLQRRAPLEAQALYTSASSN
jgi:hypothetical protein